MIIPNASLPISVQSPSNPTSADERSPIATNTQDIRAFRSNTLRAYGPLTSFICAFKTLIQLVAHLFKNSPHSSPLRKRLSDALLPGLHPHQKFLPVTAYDTLLTEATIRAELASHPCPHVSRNAARWAAIIASPSEASETGLKKIFGILCLIGHVDLIERFIESEPRHSDNELPFKQGDLLMESGQDNPSAKYEFLRALNDLELEGILQKQWSFLVPVFRGGETGIPVHNLSDGVILPMSECNEKRLPDAGHSGTVFKAMVHAAHYSQEHESGHLSDTGDPAPVANVMVPCAVKELHLECVARYGGQYTDSYTKEVDNLSRVRDIRHDNLIKLLFAYIYKGYCHLVFPWADANLLAFWRDEFPDPDMTGPQDCLARWIFSQARGLVEALELIHGNAAGTASNGQGISIHGIHGDLKPQNILWFKGISKLHEVQNLGILKISDFAGTQFHRMISKSRVIWNELHTTDTYQAPETVAGHMVGQSYDLWSLGCVFLEFVTWLIQGWDGVDKFSKARSADNDPLDAPAENNDVYHERYEQRRRNSNWAEFSPWTAWLHDTFFYRLPRGSQIHISGARLKQSVINHLNQLYKDPECSRFCAAFLKVIEECFLRINKRNRVSAKEVLERFDVIGREGELDPGYWIEPLKTPLRANSNLSELGAEAPDPVVVPGTSPQMEDCPEGGHYVSEAQTYNKHQSIPESPIAVARAEDNAPRTANGLLAPVDLQEGEKRVSCSSSQTAVSVQSGSDEQQYASYGRKIGMEVDELEPGAVIEPRKRDRIKEFFKAIVLEMKVL
ncbi:hypothetical protein PG988_016153 [Apiospora saccharicola]